MTWNTLSSVHVKVIAILASVAISSLGVYTQEITMNHKQIHSCKTNFSESNLEWIDCGWCVLQMYG